MLSQLKKLSKSNDVYAQNKTFSAVRSELLLLLKIRVTVATLHLFINGCVLKCIFL